MKTVEYKTDLCVVGGGMAGVCCAVAAAREGARVVLMHERAMLGGNASSENRMWVCGARGKNNRETGIIEEIMLENLYRNPTKNFYIWDAILLDFVRREKNITLLLNTTCIDGKKTEGEFAHGRKIKLKSVKGYQMTTQTFFEVSADYFADCSGDSILAPISDAEFDYGREAADEYGEQTQVTVRDKNVMGMSCLIQGRQTDRDVKFTPSEFATRLTDDDVKNRPMDIYDPTENFWYLELGGTEDTIHDAEKTKTRLYDLALGTWDYIKNSGNYDADKWELEFLGALPAKRESRRMRGEYTVTQCDISGEKRFDDTVAYGGWPIDDHFPGGYYHKGTPNTNFHTPAPYPLPYRALYSKNVDNLFFAGRNISMTHTAMSSIRVMATCALLGQAVGTAAAVAKKYGVCAHDVYLEHICELQAHLTDADCFLPYVQREVSDACKNATLIGADDAVRDGRDRANRIYGTESCGYTVKNGNEIKYCFDNKKIESVHIVFDSDLDRNTIEGHRCERTHVTRANVLLDSPQMYLPLTLCKGFILKADDDIIFSTDNNIKRAYHIKTDVCASSLTLVVDSNWGNTDSTNVISFDFKGE